MIKELIPPMNYTHVKAAICQLLANIRDSQKEFANDEFDSNFIDFTIFPKRFRFPSVEDLPCVYVYFNEADIPLDQQDIYSNQFNYTLQVEYYAGGLNETENGELIYFADEEASDRLDYLTSQIYHSLCSEPTNIYQATNKLVNSFHLKKWERILTPREVNSTESVLGAMFTFTVGIEENTFYQNTLQIKEFYEQLKIRDEFIDTLTKKIIGE